jgi:hypothetical protein
MDATARYEYQSRALQGTLTLVAVLLSFAALHDIAGGRESDLTNEYAALVVCGGWLLGMSIGLMRSSRHWLGGVSLAVLASAVVAQRAIGPGVAPTWAASVVYAAWLWFGIVAVVLAASALRIGPWRGAAAP